MEEGKLDDHNQSSLQNESKQVLKSVVGKPFEFVWVIKNWSTLTSDQDSDFFMVDNLSFHLRACRPAQSTQFFSIKVILGSNPPGPKTFQFIISVINNLDNTKTISKRSSKAYSKLNSYDILVYFLIIAYLHQKDL